MKHLKLFLLFILLSSTSFGQTKQYLELGQTFSKAKVYLKNDRIIRTNDFHYQSDSSIIFTKDGTSQEFDITKAEIKYLYKKNGTYAGLYGTVGGLIGLLSALKYDLKIEDNSGNAAVYAGFVGGFGLVGALIGSTQPKWTRVYLDREKVSYLNSNFLFYNKALAINLVYKF